MGVSGLWEFLKSQSDVECSIGVSQLKGKTLSVDVSGWIVELEHRPSPAVVHRHLHIRNLFFRITGLLNEGVKLVAVLDGRAPALKSDTLMKRSQSSTANLDRPFLNQQSKQCAELFEYFGVPCIQSPGEAEALCAYLEKNKLTDGCITTDSDYFCYGGRTVYRDLRKEGKNFRLDKYGVTGDMDITHEDFTALAIILGCDYVTGIEGVGPTKSMKLIKYLKSKNYSVLDRIQSWRDNQELIDIEKRISGIMKKASHCKQCQHPGTEKSHMSNGCCMCETTVHCTVDSSVTCTCPWHELKQLETEHKFELTIRKKALEKPDFPNLEVIKEFTVFTMDDPIILQSGAIDVNTLIPWIKIYMPNEKTIEHINRAVILQDLRNSIEPLECWFVPVRINKKCVENHVECYLVEWQKTDKNKWANYEHVVEKIERELFKSVYSEYVANFEAQQTPKKTPKGKKKKNEDSSQPSCSPEKKQDIRNYFQVKK